MSRRGGAGGEASTSDGMARAGVCGVGGAVLGGGRRGEQGRVPHIGAVRTQAAGGDGGTVRRWRVDGRCGEARGLWNA